MSKARLIWPGFFSDATICALSLEARLGYIAIWCHADDYGRGKFHPKTLDGFAFPLDDFERDAWLEELIAAGLIRPYEVDGEKFFDIPTFEEYQKGQKHRRKSLIPENPGKPSRNPGKSSRETGKTSPNDQKPPETLEILPSGEKFPESGEKFPENLPSNSNSNSDSDSTTEVEKLDASVLSISEEKSDPETGLTVWVDEDGIQRKREDLLWLAVAEFHGRPTDAEEGKFGRALKNLRKARVRPDEYGNLVAAYVAKNGDDVADPTAITISTRVGELRNFLQRGPLRLPSEREQALDRFRKGGSDD